MAEVKIIVIDATYHTFVGHEETIASLINKGWEVKGIGGAAQFTLVLLVRK